jgi:c(7)-type cytochrome triheme protein
MRALQILLGIVLVGGLLGTVWFMFTAPTSEVAAIKSAPSQAAPPVVLSNAPPPDTIVFENKGGRSVFTHKLHYERVQDDCTVCHTKIFPQSQAPLNYGKALHRAAEANETACAACHRVGGTSFAADSNCVKCHEVKY